MFASRHRQKETKESRRRPVDPKPVWWASLLELICLVSKSLSLVPDESMPRRPGGPASVDVITPHKKLSALITGSRLRIHPEPVNSWWSQVSETIFLHFLVYQARWLELPRYSSCQRSLPVSNICRLSYVNGRKNLVCSLWNSMKWAITLGELIARSKSLYLQRLCMPPVESLAIVQPRGLC